MSLDISDLEEELKNLLAAATGDPRVCLGKEGYAVARAITILAIEVRAAGYNVSESLDALTAELPVYDGALCVSTTSCEPR